MVKIALTQKQISDMKQRAGEIVSTYGKRDSSLFARYREMYFMEDEARKPMNSRVDEQDWAITVSPSSRNEVIGMVRLLDTSEIGISIEGGSSGNKMEAALKDILRISGRARRARIETDSALSAVLYGPVCLYYEAVEDLIGTTANKYTKRQLQKIQRTTPILIRTINPEQSYPEWGDYGLVSHTWKYKVNGSLLRERWGVDCRNTDYNVWDIYDCENRLVWAEGLSGELFAGPHGLSTIPIVVRYGGGTQLFGEPERQINSFLYAKAMSRLDKRENAVLTAIATAVQIGGLMGPLLAIDPENAPDNITVDYQGHIRYIMAKATQINDKVIDPFVIEWKRMLDDLGGQSTIYKQTLGQNIDAGTFSGLAMLSSAGKLPLTDPQRGIEEAFRDVFLTLLERIRESGIENELILSSDIPEDIDLTVTLTPKLPQDQLRNAQVAQSLGDLVSDEFKRALMQINDSDAMTKQVAKETMMKAMLQMIAQDPNRMKPLIEAAVGVLAPKPQPGKSQGMTPPTAEGMPPAEQMPAEQMSPEQMEAEPPMPGNGENMESIGKTEPMIPPQERGY